MAIADAGRGRRRGLAERVRPADGRWRGSSSRRSRCSPARPSIVLALFGIAAVREPGARLPQRRRTAASCSASRSSPAGAMLSLVALPLVVASVREGLQAIPNHVREASYAVGKTKIATIRRVLLPAARPSVITRHDARRRPRDRRHGDHRRCCSATRCTLQGVGNVPLLGYLRGTGSTLTSYIFDNAPTGDLNQPNKAYAAAFVLLVIVLVLNVVRRRLRPPRQGAAMELRRPPPVRRLSRATTASTRVAGARARDGATPPAGATQRQRAARGLRGFVAAPAARRTRPRPTIDRMQVEDALDLLRPASRRSSRSRCRSARARCWR